MEYKASKDMSIQIITIGVIILFLFLGYQSVMGLISAKGNITSTLIHSGVLIFLIATIVLCYLFAPQKYSISNDNCIIHRPISDIIIPLDSIIEIREVNKSELKGMIRTFGVGGLFGNYGKFHTSGLGNITMYGTQNKNFILLKVGNRKILLTPDNLSIIDQIKNRK
jgi:hypothetical protein